jgi:hypothetical protein
MKNPVKYVVILTIIVLLTNCYLASALDHNSKTLILSDDTTPPVTTYIIEGEKFGRNFIGNVTITFNATDDESGIKKTWIGWHLGGGAMMWEVYEEPITISYIGIKTLDYWSEDYAGNEEDKKTFSLTIIEDLGYLLAIGNFEESITRYTGDFEFMMFIGFINKDFQVISDQDKYLIIEKGKIIQNLIIKSNILLIKILKFPEL